MSTRQTNMEVLIVSSLLNARARNLLHGGVRSSSRVCAGVCEGVSIVCRVTRHVASTYGRSMTNGANYKRGKLHHSPWHSDIRTSNQLNNPFVNIVHEPKDGSKKTLKSVCDFECSGVYLRMLKVAVTFSGMKASYINHLCHGLWCKFTAPLIPCNTAEKNESLSYTSHHYLLCARIRIVGSWIESHLCSVRPSKDHRRDST